MRKDLEDTIIVVIHIGSNVVKLFNLRKDSEGTFDGDSYRAML
jgi:hypothetical protein